LVAQTETPWFLPGFHCIASLLRLFLWVRLAEHAASCAEMHAIILQVCINHAKLWAGLVLSQGITISFTRGLLHALTEQDCVLYFSCRLNPLWEGNDGESALKDAVKNIGGAHRLMRIARNGQAAAILWEDAVSSCYIPMNLHDVCECKGGVRCVCVSLCTQSSKGRCQFMLWCTCMCACDTAGMPPASPCFLQGM